MSIKRKNNHNSLNDACPMLYENPMNLLINHKKGRPKLAGNWFSLKYSIAMINCFYEIFSNFSYFVKYLNSAQKYCVKKLLDFRPVLFFFAGGAFIVRVASASGRLIWPVALASDKYSLSKSM
ncbi:hypothetical protein BpHYR1_031527 [Brachionus plicatilis]|uniref:Uncharacterized protein n=1 Tax=Brachionus plicatilis TaxID=10195 RepID=A0A3M7Q225_BRAPC|nr:hypothetical protein BpHYR1_031527 [Brachionus plicatilis]